MFTHLTMIAEGRVSTSVQEMNSIKKNNSPSSSNMTQVLPMLSVEIHQLWEANPVHKHKHVLKDVGLRCVKLIRYNFNKPHTQFQWQRFSSGFSAKHVVFRLLGEW